MTVVAVAGVKHSPGATTLAVALAMATAGGALVIEADPAGGDVAVRARCAVDPGMVSLAAAARHGMSPEVIAEHVQHLGSGVTLLAGPVSARHATAALRAVAEPLAQLCAQRPGLTLVDLGRVDDPGLVVPFLTVADLVVLVVRPTGDDIAGARSRLKDLAQYSRAVSVAVVGSGPFPIGDVADALGAVVVTVPWDPRSEERRVGKECRL